MMQTISSEQVYKWLEDVPDPEIPAISIVELGVVRGVQCLENQVLIDLTPTYSGCPAMKVIEEDIIARLRQEGIANVKVRKVLSPAWTTDWMSEATREKLRLSGIAPPDRSDKPSKVVLCPHCQSARTKLTSWFGSTACKSLFTCQDCLQPFDHFKCI